MLNMFPVLRKLTYMQSIAITRLDKGKRSVNEINCKHQGTRHKAQKLFQIGYVGNPKVCKQLQQCQSAHLCKSVRVQEHKSTKAQKDNCARVQNVHLWTGKCSRRSLLPRSWEKVCARQEEEPLTLHTAKILNHFKDIEPIWTKLLDQFKIHPVNHHPLKLHTIN